MTSYILAMGFILALLVGWIAVQQLYRSFAVKHPEFGPVQDEGGGCGGGCACGSRSSCSKK